VTALCERCLLHTLSLRNLMLPLTSFVVRQSKNCCMQSLKLNADNGCADGYWVAAGHSLVAVSQSVDCMSVSPDGSLSLTFCTVIPPRLRVPRYLPTISCLIHRLTTEMQLLPVLRIVYRTHLILSELNWKRMVLETTPLSNKA